MSTNHSQRIRPVIEEVASEEKSPEKPALNPEEKAKAVLKELSRSSSPTKTNYKLIIFVTLITALIVGFVSGGVYVYFSGVSSFDKAAQAQPQTSSATPLPTPVTTTSPSPKPNEKIDVSSYKVSVLNGSGRIGEASKVSDSLEKAGFTVTNKANASRYDYQETLIQATDKVPQNVVELITNTLSENYQTKPGDPLVTTSQYDIIITVGSK